MKKVQTIAVVMALLVFSPSLLHAADVFQGKWVLDPKRSKYMGATCPRKMIIEVTATADGGEQYHSETELMNGKTFSADYTATYDGIAAMVKGAHGVLLPVSLHREGSHTIVARYMSGLETRATSRRFVSADRQTMTVTTASQDGGGITFTNIGVYRRTNVPAATGFDLQRAAKDIVERHH